MTTDIFIVTYAADARWLEYCLRSIDKFATGFRQTVVAYPAHEQHVLGPICAAHKNVLQRIFPQGTDGHLDQNIAKTCADMYSDADQILHLDSDCVFFRPVTPDTYCTDGKPDLWYEYYDRLTPARYPGGVPWQEITRNALCIPVTVETMRRFPFVYPRWLYEKTRRRIEESNHVDFDGYVRGAPCMAGAFHGYSEFNALGCMAFYVYPEHFKLNHMSFNCDKPNWVTQYWSHWLRKDPLKFEREILPELERITAPEGEQHAA